MHHSWQDVIGQKQQHNRGHDPEKLEVKPQNQAQQPILKRSQDSQYRTECQSNQQGQRRDPNRGP